MSGLVMQSAILTSLDTNLVKDNRTATVSRFTDAMLISAASCLLMFLRSVSHVEVRISWMF